MIFKKLVGYFYLVFWLLIEEINEPLSYSIEDEEELEEVRASGCCSTVFPLSEFSD